MIRKYVLPSARGGLAGLCRRARAFHPAAGARNAAAGAAAADAVRRHGGRRRHGRAVHRGQRHQQHRHRLATGRRRHQGRVRIGQTVKAGDLLFELDTRQTEADLKVAAQAQDVPVSEAQVEVAEANLRPTQDQYERAKNLLVTRELSPRRTS